MTSNHKHTHAQWGSRLGFILAAVGSAVGLGNIWKFPYMLGKSGGSAFMFTYLACIVLIGLPILSAEWLIGRRGQRNPIDAMKTVAQQEGRSKAWAIIGASGTLGGYLILSFYSVIGGWSLNYIFKSGSGLFSGMTGEQTGAVFTSMLADPTSLLIWHTVFMAVTIFIVAAGVTGGLERGSKILMPLLAVFLGVLVIYGANTGHFGEALSFLFKPDWGAINADVLLSALGHAFFTLSLGMGIMLAYGSYLGKEVNLLRSASIVVILDTAIAVLAGLAIFPIVFANGLDTEAGPGLVFVTLPIAFGNMSGGTVLGLIFFLLLSFAAITSSISLLESSVEFLEERTSLNRVGSTIVAGVVVWLIGIGSALSFNVWSEVKLMGLNIFDLLDVFTSKFILPVSGFAIVVFMGWFMKQDSIRDELRLGGAFKLWQFIYRVIAPVGVIIVFVQQLIG
ncbi:sodium-dependent transporter [Neisseria montereyensis]|uniref:Sodium-dependent transporter n=1 Tax=Neisseria montereyensis TaxID=2973938 RepID=A0ABT2FBL6_9NEIS|nr:sodium-dependent transporter [Neisseria montereyensis]MCS4533356.1 sodium-dependent transporter [Neisseria montereyensis]